MNDEVKLKSRWVNKKDGRVVVVLQVEPRYGDRGDRVDPSPERNGSYQLQYWHREWRPE